MTRREWALALLFAAAGGLIVWGLLPFSVGLARVAGGVLLGVWGWLVLAEDEAKSEGEG